MSKKTKFFPGVTLLLLLFSTNVLCYVSAVFLQFFIGGQIFGIDGMLLSVLFIAVLAAFPCFPVECCRNSCFTQEG
ncbi:MAG: hypothetical protein PHH28_06925 [Desulfuromonadaceae bacterium]|nr:hypothetical protein [Desulfuromonadaceae bacterium]